MSYQFSVYRMERLSMYADIDPGYAFKSEQFTDNVSDIPLVKGENVQQGYVDWSISKYWPAADMDNHKKYILKVGDIVLAMDRPWVTSGLKWAYIKPHDPTALLVQRVARLRARSALDQTYLRCLISSGYFSAYIQPIVTGVNVPHISGRQIGDFKIPVPEFSIQKKIAAILSSYDDLIENNQRRIALLEKMAEEIYREWFVRLRFPGYQQVKFEKGVPEGWAYKPINKLVDFLSGYSFKSETYVSDGKYGIVTIKNVHDGRFEHDCSDFIEAPPSNMKRHCFLEEGDILMSLTGNVGRVCRVNAKGLLLNQRVAKLKPRIKNIESFVYWLFRQPSIQTLTEMISTGAAQQNLSPIKLGNQQIYIPPKELLDLFEENVSENTKFAMQLEIANKMLKQARDMLLPRLISGKLSVEHLDIQYPPSMQDCAL